MSDLSTRLEELELMSSQGDKVRLALLWSNRPVVLAFIRHFG